MSRIVRQFLLAVAAAGLLAGCRRSQPPQVGPADYIFISKSAHTLTLLRNGQNIGTYRVSLGKGGRAPKTRQGDHLTPEGLYVVDGRKPNSRFYKALHISYPNKADSQRAANAHVSPGGDIEIHGVQNGFGWLGPTEHWIDWTDGCVALTDPQMDEVWNAVLPGTPVEIRY